MRNTLAKKSTVFSIFNPVSNVI